MNIDERDKFKDYLRSLYEVYKNSSIETEEATKMSLIIPIIKLWGYNVFDPTEFCPEMTADIGVGIKNGEKVDYAIKRNNKVQILVECKHHKEKNLSKHVNQLFRYFSVTPAKLGILTNGVEWRFYSDTKQANIMDTEPFYVFRLDKIRDIDVSILPLFSKVGYTEESIRIASSMQSKKDKYVSIYKDKIDNFFRNQENYIDTDYANLIFDMIFQRDMPKEHIDIIVDLMKQAVVSSRTQMQVPVFQQGIVGSTKRIVQERNTINTVKIESCDSIKLSDIILNRKDMSFCKIVKLINTKTGTEYDIRSWASFIEIILNDAITMGMTVDEVLSLDGTNTVDTGWLRAVYNGVPENSCQKFVQLSNGLWLNTYGNASAMCQKLYRACSEFSQYFNCFVVKLVTKK